MWIYGKDYNLYNLSRKLKIGTFFVCDYIGEDEFGIILSLQYIKNAIYPSINFSCFSPQENEKQDWTIFSEYLHCYKFLI